MWGMWIFVPTPNHTSLSYLLTPIQREQFGCGFWPTNQEAVSHVLKGYQPSLLAWSLERQGRRSVLRSISGLLSNDEQPRFHWKIIRGSYRCWHTFWHSKEGRALFKFSCASLKRTNAISAFVFPPFIALLCPWFYAELNAPPTSQQGEPQML